MRVQRSLSKKQFVAAVVFGLLTHSATSASTNTVLGIAVELGIVPESVVIANVNEMAALMVLSRIDQATTLCENLMAAHEAVGTAAANVTALSILLMGDSENDTLVQQYEVAIQTQAAAQEQVAALRDELFAFAAEGLNEQQIDAIAIWRDGSAYRVDPAFRTTQRTHEDWKVVEEALRAERRALRMGEELHEEYAELLMELRAEPAVPEASALLEANLEGMQQVFEQFAE